MYLYGVDVGGTSIKIGFFKVDHTLIDKWEIKTDRSDHGSHIIDDIVASIKKYNKQQGILMEQIRGIGIGVPGPVVGGVVNKAVNLGWGKIDLETELRGKIDIGTIAIANDANAAVAGEVWAGSGKKVSNLIMFTLGTGVGGGIIQNGILVEGKHGSAGEVGHIVVNPESDNLCSCGNYGCLETYSSATGIVNNTIRVLNTYDEKSTLRDVKNMTAKDVFEHAKQGDNLALKAVNRLCEYIGYAAATLATSLDPDLILIGGGVSNAGSILIEKIEHYYKKYAFHAVKNTKIDLAKLGNDAGIYGAAYLAMMR